MDAPAPPTAPPLTVRALTVRALTVREIHLPMREPFRISSGGTQDRRILLVEVEDDDGAAGWGECVAGEEPYYSAETVDTAWLAIERWLAPRLLGRSFEHPRQVHAALGEGVCGHRMAKASVEMACWELAAVLVGVPLARLLGGERRRVEVGISLGLQRSPEALAERAAEELARGYRKIKLKIAPGADVDWVAAVRRALGPEAPLMADANSAYTPEDADRLAALDDLGLMMIEQPLEHDDLLRHAALQKRLATPLCLDESITSPERAEDMIALGAGRIVNIKPGRVGGFTPSLAIHGICRRAGVPVWCGGMLESGVGRAHNVALASLPGFTLPGDISPSRRYWHRDVVEPEWTMEAGAIAVPWERPGMGVAVDRPRLAALTARQVRYPA